MTKTTIRRDQHVNETLAMTGDDLLRVAAGGELVVADAPSVLLSQAAGARIVNHGTIGTVSGEIAGDFALNNAASGLLGAVTIDSERGVAGEIRVVNAGTIDGAQNVGLDLSNAYSQRITVVNEAGALIRSVGSAPALRPGNDTAGLIVVHNAGTILCETPEEGGFSGDGIGIRGNGGVGDALITNAATGHIEGGRHGITGDNGATIANAAGGEIIGRNGSGVNFDTTAQGHDLPVIVVNDGLISGRYDGSGDGDGDGVDVDYLLDVTNRGRIEGLGADRIENFADGIAAGGGVIRNLAGGEIYGESRGVLIDDSNLGPAFAATRIENAGTITAVLDAAVRLVGGFDDTIVNTGTIATDAGWAIEMGGGADLLRTGGLIHGAVDLGDGDDTLRVGSAARIEGSVDLGVGNDTVRLGGHVTGDIRLGDGDDTLRSTAIVAGTLDGGAGNDRITGGDAIERIAGGDGNDRLYGGAGDDRLDGGDGDDQLHGGVGIDVLAGGAGDDRLFAGDGLDTMIGGVGDDTYFLGDTFRGIVELAGEGTDTILTGVDAIDPLQDNVENLTLTGDTARYAVGNEAANVLTGSDTANEMYGQGGDDVLVGGGGQDVLYGEAGADRFVFTAVTDSGADLAGADQIGDFGAGDTIDLSRIDANAGHSGNQAFHLIGDAVFSGVAGELRVEAANGGLAVAGDTDGDGVADFTLLVFGAATPADLAFLL